MMIEYQGIIDRSQKVNIEKTQKKYAFHSQPHKI